MRKKLERMLNRIANRAAARCALIAIAACVVPPGQAAPAPASEATATVTIVEGSAQLLRGDKRLRIEEGLRLLSQDIVETAADTRVTRIEFSDGLAVNLGPSTRLLVDPRFQGERGRAARVYLLGGWLKSKSGAAKPDPKATTKPSPLLASPAVDVLDAGGTLVVNVAGDAFTLFVESGSASIQERRDGKPVDSARPIASGQFLERAQRGKTSTAARPASDFLNRMPRIFIEPLPDRAALFSNRNPVAKEIGRIAYTDAADWLAVEPTLRRPAINRWRPLARDPEFRKGLVDNMKAHPEWDRVLFPEKYQPRY